MLGNGDSTLAELIGGKLRRLPASNEADLLAAPNISPEHQLAAVVLILREYEGEIQLLLIKRAEDSRDPWSGHIALPGGRAEPDDENLLATAVRETREEVGIDLATDGEILGQLDALHPSNPRLPKILVTPLVAVVRSDVTARASSEVQTVFWVSLDSLTRTGRTETVERIFEGNRHTWPAYPSPQGPVWGLTERILTQFLSLL